MENTNRIANSVQVLFKSYAAYTTKINKRVGIYNKILNPTCVNFPFDYYSEKTNKIL